jgi:hypothetical protein
MMKSDGSQMDIRQKLDKRQLQQFAITVASHTATGNATNMLLWT